MATSFSGGIGMRVYRATIIAHALRFYAKTGMKVNSAYTPKAMIAAAREMLGPEHHIKARGYLHAANELERLAQKLAPEARAKGEIK